MQIPFALPVIEEDEIQAVAEVMRSGWITTGPKTAEFEKKFAAYIGCGHALAVNSATSGLHLALEALGIGGTAGEKHAVVTSPYTFAATAEVVRYLGADPLFVDVDAETYNMDPARLERFLSTDCERRDGKLVHKSSGAVLKAIIPVHIAGLACDMPAIMAIARRFGLPVVEDAAHALPTTSAGKKIGTISDITVFSFYATKTITTAEGGMVVTDNAEFAKRMKVMRLHGINRDVWDRYTNASSGWYYEVVAPGYKYNLTDIASAMGLRQLEKCDRFYRRRKEMAERYTKAFAHVPGLRVPLDAQGGDLHAWHLYVLQVLPEKANGLTRDHMIKGLKEKGVGTSVHFIPLHMHPYYKERYGYSDESFPVACGIYRKSLSLPIYPSMTDAQVDYVIASVLDILKKGC